MASNQEYLNSKHLDSDNYDHINRVVTDKLLKQVVMAYNKNLSLISWNASSASIVGDNYMSVLYAVELVLEGTRKNAGKENLNVIFKTLPLSPYRKKFIGEMKLFPVEVSMYQQVLPALKNWQAELETSGNDQFQPWPTCYFTRLDEEADLLVLENLKADLYKTGCRLSGLDFIHCSTVLRSLARFHAISYVKYGGDRDKILQDFPRLGNCMFSKESKVAGVHQQVFCTTLKVLSTSLTRMGETLASSKIDKMAKADIGLILGNLLQKQTECAVIIHGDCWLNNILFKYDVSDTNEKCPIDVKFIDFQLSTAGSRLIDVYYFLMTSCPVEILNRREDDLLMIYYAEFTHACERMGIHADQDALTWKNFVQEADNFRIYGVFMALLLAPMQSADNDSIPNMEAFTEKEFENTEEVCMKFFNTMTTNEVMRKVKNLVLVHLQKCPNFDFLL